MNRIYSASAMYIQFISFGKGSKCSKKYNILMKDGKTKIGILMITNCGIDIY